MVNQNVLKLEGMMASANGAGLAGLYLLLEYEDPVIKATGGGLVILSVVMPFIRGIMKGGKDGQP